MSMDPSHSEPDTALLRLAREKLRDRPRQDGHWAALGAAALFALCAIAFAAAAVLAPPLSHDPAAKVGVK